MAWTEADLTKLEEAIASGAKSVQYENKKVDYHTLDEMLKLRDLMRKSLGKITNEGNRIKTSYSKGLCE